MRFAAVKRSANEYASLKLHLAERFSRDREAYTQVNGPIVQRLLSLCEQQRKNAT